MENSHSSTYLRKLKSIFSKPEPDIISESEQFDSIYFNSHSLNTAKLAAGGLSKLLRRVVQGACFNGVALVRPPGHHAETHCAKGFCLFNNVAIAAKYALDQLNVQRILIVDWDVHHGNGTQKMFISDPRVLYFSVHRYDQGSFYPFGADGSPSVTGQGDGRGYNINVAWNCEGMGDCDYLATWQRILLPVANAYQPDLILVSAGFDAAKGDPLGRCELTPNGYHSLLKALLPISPGKVIVVLEGGYSLSALRLRYYLHI